MKSFARSSKLRSRFPASVFFCVMASATNFIIDMEKKLFKNYIQEIKPYQPGKPIKEVERELGIRGVVKLASNENALGPSRKAMRAMRRAIREAHLYPDGASYYLVNRLAQEFKLDPAQFVIGNGSNEIIELLARGFLSDGDEVISSEASFLVYPILAQSCGAGYKAVPMKDYRYDLKAILAAITPKTKIIFIANPNNPTGTYVTEREVKEFLDAVPRDVIVCFDEAYVDFVDAVDFPRMMDVIRSGRPNTVILRTFSKSYGLAGLRIGYAVTTPELANYLHKIRQPFNVNSIAQAAATAALDDRFFLWRTKTMVAFGRRYFYKRFQKLGLTYLPSQANFVLLNTGRNGEEVYKTLMTKGVIVRPMSAYGFPEWIRVTVGRRSQNALFYRTLKHILKTKS